MYISFQRLSTKHEAMDSGQISLDTIETSGLDSNINYMFDCVWLVTCRYHTYGSDGKELPPKMFLSVLEANLVEGKPTTRLFSYLSIVIFYNGCFPISVLSKSHQFAKHMSSLMKC